MDGLKFRVITEGSKAGIHIPLNIVYLDRKDIEQSGLCESDAIQRIAKAFDGPTGINVFDMDCVTTTSDGIMVEGAIVTMVAADRGKINADFGTLHMAEIDYSEQIVREEPHLRQWQALFPDRKLFRGPDPATKIIPVHNVVITGRASNNNSATEMMNIITMEEILLPILGQLAIMRDKPVLTGMTGEVISVGIGMTVAEKFGRVFPHRQFRAGDTAHDCQEYAKTLKKNIPCIVADKPVLARCIAQSLEIGMVPGRDLGCSPAVLAIAKRMHQPIDFDNMTAGAYSELASIGITKTWLQEKVEKLTADQVVAQADAIIPGAENCERHAASDLAEWRVL